MTEQINAVIASFSDHITIRTKLQNSQPGEPAEVQLNRNFITKYITKKPHQDWQKEKERIKNTRQEKAKARLK